PRRFGLRPSLGLANKLSPSMLASCSSQHLESNSGPVGKPLDSIKRQNALVARASQAQAPAVIAQLAVDGKSRFKGAPPVLAGDPGRMITPHGSQERGDFLGQGVAGRIDRVVESD